MISVSSRNHPSPMPNRNLPLERWSRVAISLASSSGWCSGTKQIPVPNLRVVVTVVGPRQTDEGITDVTHRWRNAAIRAALVSRRHMHRHDPMSGSHRDSNPSASALWATTATSSDGWKPSCSSQFSWFPRYSLVISMGVDKACIATRQIAHLALSPAGSRRRAQATR